MSQAGKNHHPSLEALLDHAEGLLGEPETAQVARHLESCPLCRLELARLADFSAAAEDPEQLVEAAWDQAALQLERAWQDEIRPSLAARAEQELPAPRPRTLRIWWWAPVAAAAVLVFMVLQPGGRPQPGLMNGDELEPGATSVVRGSGEIAAPTIGLVQPVGPSAAAPDSFLWRTPEACELFTLEIFTADLDLIFHQEGIPGQAPSTSHQFAFATPDTLRAALQPGVTYLWSVKGFSHLQQVAESDNGWFLVE